MLQNLYVRSGQVYVPVPIHNSHNCLRILIKSCISMYVGFDIRIWKLCDQRMLAQRQNWAKCTRILIKVVGPMCAPNGNIVRTDVADISKIHRDSHQKSNTNIKTQNSIIKNAQGFSWRYTRKVRRARRFSKKSYAFLRPLTKPQVLHRFYDFEIENQYVHTGFADKCVDPEERDL